MEYLFFDIECASVSKKAAKICAFGYCLTDEKFNIIEQKDLLINPQGGFHLTDRRGEKGLVLPYDYKGFSAYPVFPKLYPFIRELLSGDRIVVGHSIINDVKFINLELNRFSLEHINYEFFDTQFAYMNKIKVFDRQFALETIARELGVEFTPHRAVDDAYATMRIAEAMCKEEDCDLLTLMQRYGITSGRTVNGEVKNCSSKLQEEFFKASRAEKERRERVRSEFNSFVFSRRHERKNNKLKGKIFTFNKKIEENLPVSKEYIREIFLNGGSYSVKSETCNVYVKTADDNSVRYKNALKNQICVVEEGALKEFINGL